MGPCEIPFEQRWSTDIANDLTKMMKEPSKPSINSEQYMRLYTTIYEMCIQQPHDYSKQLYYKYCQLIEDNIKQTVLPSLREKHDEGLLRDLVERWSNHKVMVRWLSRFFHYVDRYFVTRNSLPTTKEVGFKVFHDLVYHEMHSKAIIVVLTHIREEREGKEIDRELMKNVLDVFIENGMDKYEGGFESFVLHDTTSYYSRMATNWIEEDSCPDYMIKAEECLKKERERINHYLYSSTEPKLVKIVENELLVVVAKRLLENENSGCHALLRDAKMDDLSRMYRLYHKIPQGLEPIADIFKQHVTAEGNVLIKQAQDADTNQVVISKVSDLHNKYKVYVTECFQNHTLFHKALKEAFEIFCDESVAGSSSAELLAMFCSSTP